MKANEFVKQHGFDGAYELWEGSFNLFENDLCILSGSVCRLSDSEPLFSLCDLKRLIESHELVKEHGTIERTKEYANSPYTAPEVKERLKQATADVESCL